MENMSVELEQLVAAELEREVVEESSLSHSLGLPSEEAKWCGGRRAVAKPVSRTTVCW